MNREEFNEKVSCCAGKMIAVGDQKHPLITLAAASRIHTTFCIRAGVTPEVYENNLLPNLLKDYQNNWEKYVKEIDK